MAGKYVPYPEWEEDPNEYSFTDEENAEIQRHIEKYPDSRSAIMPALWIAQEKYGWLPPKLMMLVAETVGQPYALVYGVATFYTMYLKENKAKNLIEVCTCFTCGECGGRELYEQLRTRLDVDERGVSADKQYYLREAECLGACDTAPVAQVNNWRMVFNADEPGKLDAVFEKLQNGGEIEYTRIPLIDQSQL